MYVNDALLDAIRDLPKVVKYMDIPLQHASKETLRRMRRPTNEWVGDLVDRIRAGVPGIAIRTSLIVGFPGETEEEFQELYDFVKNYRLDHVGVFLFSPEDDTHSATLENRVPKKVAQARRSKIMALQQQISQEIHDGLVGTVIPMLVESIEAKSGILIGRSFRDAPDVDGTVFARCEDTTVEPGDIVDVKVTVAKPYDLHGEVVSASVLA
jgi:ribosomal protein S12 methylthiotransferase